MSNRRRRQKQQAQSRQQAPTSGTATTFTQNRYVILYLINVIIAFLWQMVMPLFGLLDYVIGFGIGLLGIWLYDRAYGRRAYLLASFGLYVLWEIVKSNLSLAKLVLQPNPNLDPGIIAIPLTVSSGLEIMILASVITLTPGTISVDLGHNTLGEQVLYVHNLTVGDPAAFRAEVKAGFERRLLQVTRGVEA
ncbi:MAG: Na+/H+ antiporter subunit E [Caldilineaceae bacterium]